VTSKPCTPSKNLEKNRTGGVLLARQAAAKILGKEASPAEEREGAVAREEREGGKERGSGKSGTGRESGTGKGKGKGSGIERGRTLPQKGEGDLFGGKKSLERRKRTMGISGRDGIGKGHGVEKGSEKGLLGRKNRRGGSSRSWKRSSRRKSSGCLRNLTIRVWTIYIPTAMPTTSLPLFLINCLPTIILPISRPIFLPL